MTFPSSSNGPQNVIPGARLLLLGLMGVRGDVGQLEGPSGVTTTLGITALLSAPPELGLPLLSDMGGSAASSCSSLIWACFSLRWRKTKISTTRMTMSSRQANSGRMIRRGSEAGRGRIS